MAVWVGVYLRVGVGVGVALAVNIVGCGWENCHRLSTAAINNTKWHVRASVRCHLWKMYIEFINSLSPGRIEMIFIEVIFTVNIGGFGWGNCHRLSTAAKCHVRASVRCHLWKMYIVCINSLAPGGFLMIFIEVIFKLILMIDSLSPNECHWTLLISQH